MKKVAILLAIVLPMMALMYFSLTRSPRDLPSTLVGRQAPNFDLSILDSEKKASLQNLRGNLVVLNFWATWCNSCAVEHKLLRQAHDLYAPEGIQFFSVLYEDKPENAKEFVAQYGSASEILLDPGLKTAIDYGVSGVPETFFINKDGVVVYKHSGPLTPQVLMGQIEVLKRS